MYFNARGEAFCQTVDDLRQFIDEAGLTIADIYIERLVVPLPYCLGEIYEKGSKELFCYIEADNCDIVRKIAREVKIPGADTV